ncbi:MAG: alginate lyase family protein [Burkholderiales bacterium]
MKKPLRKYMAGRAIGLWMAGSIVVLAACGGGGSDVGDSSGTAPHGSAGLAATFAHPGLLHTQQDLNRMQTQVNNNAQPWTAGWQRLTANAHASLDWTPQPQAIVYRGADGTHPENYASLFRDTAAAYALALRWKVSGDDAYAEKAVAVLDAWSLTLTAIGGTSDKFLASGIYGYQFANAAEIMRGYSKWSTDRQQRFQTMMLQVFYPMNHDFLVNHNNAKIDHYWANWDLSNMASMLAIGVLTDRRDIYQEAIDYFKHGAGNGAIDKLVWIRYPDSIGHPDALGQIQESGRDQGHSMLDLALVGALCQMAWNQGDDLFGYDSNRLLSGVEYVAQYNLGGDVPYTTYTNGDVTQTVISPDSRGDSRPIWELLYNHYVVQQGLVAPNLTAYAALVRPEGGGDYGPNSGGYDQFQPLGGSASHLRRR